MSSKPPYIAGTMSKRMTRKERKDAITAHHEAGHAVAKVMLGIDFDYVTIVSDGDAAGHVAMTRPPHILEAHASCNGDPLSDPTLAQRIEHEIIDTLADAEAQRLFFPRSRWRAGVGIDGQKYVAHGSDTSTVIRTH